MKNFLITMCLILGITSISYAQTKKAAGTAAEKAKELQEKLKLTNHQTHQIAEIYEASARKFEKIKTEEHGDNNKMAIKLAPIRRETINKIKAVLTPAQAAKFDKMIKESSGMGEGWSTGWTANS